MELDFQIITTVTSALMCSIPPPWDISLMFLGDSLGIRVQLAKYGSYKCTEASDERVELFRICFGHICGMGIGPLS